MDVEAAQPRRIENGLRQDQAVSGDDAGIEVERGEVGLCLRVAQTGGMPHWQAEFLGGHVHRRPLQFLAPPRGPRRLRIDAGDVVSGGKKRLQRRNGEGRSSHIGDTHSTGRIDWPSVRQAGRFRFCVADPKLPRMSSPEIEALVQALARLPGLGPRSARRAVLHLLKKRETALQPLVSALQAVDARMTECSRCGNIDTVDPCQICSDPKRNDTILAVVEEVADLWAMDRARLFSGRYHVLGGRLSALDGVGPDQLSVAPLMRRVREGGIEEVILALNATMEGQTTLHYLAEQLESTGVQVSTLAHGVPVGGELDYLDEGTIAQALRARTLLPR